MSVLLTRTFGKLAQIDYQAAGFARAETFWRDVGLMVRKRIRDRTERGVDAHGQAFAPLSAGYAKQKQKALGHSRADLVVSGRMLNDLQVTASTGRSVTLGWTSTGASRALGTFIQRSRAVGGAAKALWHNIDGAGKSHVKREFLDVTAEDEDAIVKDVEAAIRIGGS